MQAASPAPPTSPGGSTWEKTKRLISTSFFGTDSSSVPPPSPPPAVAQSNTPASKKPKNGAASPAGGASFMTQANQTPKRTPQHSQQSSDTSDAQRTPVVTNLLTTFEASASADAGGARLQWLSPLLQPIKNIFFSPKKPAAGMSAASPAQAAADAAAAAHDDDADADGDDADSVSTMDSVDRLALDELEEYEEEGNPFTFMYQCLNKKPKRQLECVPAKAGAPLPRLTVVLDLDETLVHAKTEPIQGSDIRFSVNFDGQNYPVWVCRRPGVNEFVKHLSTFCDVIVFTASQKVYADQLLDVLERMIGSKVIKSRYFRDSCVEVMGNYVKDLSVLDLDLSRTVIIDNSPQAFSLQIDNGIPIKSWFGSPEENSDNRLPLLLPFLAKLSTARDVRPLIKKRFKIQQRVEQHTSKVASRGGARQ